MMLLHTGLMRGATASNLEGGLIRGLRDHPHAQSSLHQLKGVEVQGCGSGAECYACGLRERAG